MLEMIVNKSSSQKRRRIVVLALYLLLVLSSIGPIIVYLDPGKVINALTLVVAVCAAVTFWVAYCALKISTQKVADQQDSVIDERQRTVRDSAYRSAYRIVVVLLLYVLLYGYFASGYGWWLPQVESMFQTALIMNLMLTITLPTAIVAWKEPDPAEEEDVA